MDDLDVLINTLIKEAPPATSKKQRRAAARKRRGEEVRRAALRAKARPKLKLIESPQWQEKRVILSVITATCECCGASYQYPGRAYLEREHPSLGMHRHACEGTLRCAVNYHDLPHVIEQVHESIPTCQRCFDITDVIEECLRAASRQRALVVYEGEQA